MYRNRSQMHVRAEAAKPEPFSNRLLKKLNSNSQSTATNLSPLHEPHKSLQSPLGRMQSVSSPKTHEVVEQLLRKPKWDGRLADKLSELQKQDKLLEELPLKYRTFSLSNNPQLLALSGMQNSPLSQNLRRQLQKRIMMR